MQQWCGGHPSLRHPSCGPWGERLGLGPQWRQLCDRYGRFKIHVPPDWVEVAPEGYGESCNLVVGEATPTQGFAANLGVQQQMVEPGFELRPDSVDEIAELMESGQTRLQYHVVERAFSKLGGKEGILLAGRFVDRGRTLRNVQVRVAHRSVSYLLTFTSLETSYAGYEPLFARMLRTLVFERPDGSWPDPPPVLQPKPTSSPRVSPQASPSSPPPSPAVPPAPSPTRGSVEPQPGPPVPSPSPSGIAR